MNVTVRLDTPGSGLAPGADIAGRVLVGPPGPARSVDAWLEFAEAVGGRRHVARRTEPVGLHSGDIPPDAVFAFSLALPPDALPSVVSAWGALGWELVVRVDRPLRRDARDTVELDVVA